MCDEIIGMTMNFSFYLLECNIARVVFNYFALICSITFKSIVNFNITKVCFDVFEWICSISVNMLWTFLPYNSKRWNTLTWSLCLCNILTLQVLNMRMKFHSCARALQCSQLFCYLPTAKTKLTKRDFWKFEHSWQVTNARAAPTKNK